tara:strand:+ start:184 stop:378 length:195 start_codon:yes stop_codon:yes gene_type:complete
MLDELEDRALTLSQRRPSKPRLTPILEEAMADLPTCLSSEIEEELALLKRTHGPLVNGQSFILK